MALALQYSDNYDRKNIIVQATGIKWSCVSRNRNLIKVQLIRQNKPRLRVEGSFTLAKFTTLSSLPTLVPWVVPQ